MHGVNERQFRSLFDRAGNMPGIHGENFMILLASRLDNVVLRLGLAKTQRQARQLVNHGHITVDGKVLYIPSYQISSGQTIGIREISQKLDIIEEALEFNNVDPEYIYFEEEKLERTLVRLPEHSELSAKINEQLIVEYSSR